MFHERGDQIFADEPSVMHLGEETQLKLNASHKPFARSLLLLKCQPTTEGASTWSVVRKPASRL
ncbi:hypothetical protein IFO70_28050 [Phormidium tenue FACHB-886]|nr:hypothetical protein [Phormidium tenue FACHB-886]